MLVPAKLGRYYDYKNMNFIAEISRLCVPDAQSCRYLPTFLLSNLVPNANTVIDDL